jgi:hypothetical protein
MVSLLASHHPQLHHIAAGYDDVDEFEQKEDVAMGIADTLQWYTIQSTFKEYLANVDDCESAT